MKVKQSAAVDHYRPSVLKHKFEIDLESSMEWGQLQEELLQAAENLNLTKKWWDKKKKKKNSNAA